MTLTETNYYSPEANQAYMSVSQFKDFEKCEAMAMAKVRGDWIQQPTTALLVGSYVDSYFEGTLPVFLGQHPELIKRDGTLKADYIQANDIIRRIEADDYFMSFLAGKKQVIMTAEFFGTQWKIKIDAYHPERIVDLKIMRSLERVMGKSFIEHWGYDIQMSVYAYTEKLKLNRKNTLETFLAVATKEDFTDLAVIRIPEWHRDKCLSWVAGRMPRILAVKSGNIQPERCEVCDYCKSTKKLTGFIEFEDVGFSTKELREMRGEYQ